MKEPASLSVVIPAYKEEARLAPTVRAAADYLKKSDFSAYEIIIVDDGSPDGTRALALRLARQRERVRVISLPRNAGKGAALRAGVLASHGSYVLTMDADLSTPMQEVEKLLAELREGHEAAIGSRKMPESIVRPQPFLRRLVGRAGNQLIRIVLALPYRDTQCGFKLYRRDAAVALFEPLLLARFSYDYDVLYRAKRMGYSVAEVGVAWADMPGSTVRAHDVLRSLTDLFVLRAVASAEEVIAFARRWGVPLDASALKFMAVGVLNTAFDAAVYILLTRDTALFAHHLIAAKFLAFLAGTVSSLLLNRSWTFGLRSRLTIAEAARFYATVLVGLVVNVEVMNVLVSFGMYDLAALCVTTVFTFASNFTLSKLWVFRPGASEAEVLARLPL